MGGRVVWEQHASLPRRSAPLTSTALPIVSCSTTFAVASIWASYQSKPTIAIEFVCQLVADGFKIKRVLDGESRLFIGALSTLKLPYDVAF